LASDPAYRYAVAFKGADVAVIEVSPNRTGRVEPAPAVDRELIASCNQAAEREPWRVDLATRCAELAASAGGRDEAIARLSALVGRGGADVRVQIALGQLLLDAGRIAEADAAFRAASGLPEAELLTQTIERGRAAVERRSSANRSEGLAEARALMDALRWSEAKAALDNAMAVAPEDPAVLMTAGELRFRLGAYDDAIAFYRRAAEGGAPRAAAQAAGLADALETEAALTTASPETIVRAASFWAANGAPGKALDLLERALAHHPGEPELSSRVGEIHRFFGLD
jgi:tetratricopeptide (TPR) repeat protein